MPRVVLSHDGASSNELSGMAHGNSNKCSNSMTQQTNNYPGCIYRDFSHITPEATMNDKKIVKKPKVIRKKVLKLPTKLDTILSNPDFTNIITWMPHGRSWIILDPKAFLQDVIPHYFDNCNYNSFIRLINAWGFRRMKTGRDQNSYYHELFLRGRPHLHKLMNRLKKDEKKVPIKGKEPDFYKIGELSPLPEYPNTSERNTNSVGNIRSCEVNNESKSSLCLQSHIRNHDVYTSFAPTHILGAQEGRPQSLSFVNNNMLYNQRYIDVRCQPFNSPLDMNHFIFRKLP